MGNFIERMPVEGIPSWLLEYQKGCACLERVTTRWGIEERMQWAGCYSSASGGQT